jgi:hypothetical protein
VAQVLGKLGPRGAVYLYGGSVPDNPNSEIKSGKVVLWCIVPKYRVQWPGNRALSSTLFRRAVDALRRTCFAAVATIGARKKSCARVGVLASDLLRIRLREIILRLG